jgi:phosphoglycolate phosphatase-like HAD superfamily hydrolase
MDGTLFQTETLLMPVYDKTFDQLRAEGLFEGPTPPEDRILSSLGMLMDQIWDNVMPGSSPEVRRRADELLLHYELEGLRQGEGKLYDGVEATLRTLKKRGLRLFVASNGLEAYIKQIVEYKGLAGLFEGLYSAGEYNTRSKADLVKLLLERHNIKSAWMVGDRSSDVEAGIKNNLTVVGCDYAGFRKEGELDGSHIRIRRFSELLDYIQ